MFSNALLLNIRTASLIISNPLEKRPVRAIKCLYPLTSVRPQMVDFGSEQGLSNFETDGVAVPALAGIAGFVEDFKRAKTPLRAKRCRLWMALPQEFGAMAVNPRRESPTFHLKFYEFIRFSVPIGDG